MVDQRRPRGAVILIVVPAVLAACAATRLKTSWQDPTVREIRFNKIVAFVVAKDEALRRNGEQELCAQLKSTPCVPAFSVIPDNEVGDVDAVRRRVDDGGFDGAVVMRLAGRRVQETYVPPSPAPMWGYYGRGWATAYDPGYVRQDELVDVETRIYSVKDAKLLWAGTTETVNPRDVRRTIREIADAVAAQLRQEGLIPHKG